MIIEQSILDNLTAQAKASLRPRMSLSFHQSLEDKCHRMRNALELGPLAPIPRHPTKEESFVLLRGKVKVSTYNDDGPVIGSVDLFQEDDRDGGDIAQERMTQSGCYGFLFRHY